MNHAKVNVGFSNYSDEGLEVKSELVIDFMTGNAHFLPVFPELTAAAEATKAYATALTAAKTGTRTEIAAKNEKRKELISKLRLLGSYVNFKADGNISILQSTGFDIRKAPSPSPEVGKPEIIRMEGGANAGEIKVLIKKVRSAKSYVYQLTTTDPTLGTTEWTNSMSTVCKFQFNNLQSGQRYWCRVAAVGKKDQMVYGDPVSRIAQ